jgi:hypothetical protein
LSYRLPALNELIPYSSYLFFALKVPVRYLSVWIHIINADCKKVAANPFTRLNLTSFQGLKPNAIELDLASCADMSGNAASDENMYAMLVKTFRLL